MSGTTHASTKDGAAQARCGQPDPAMPGRSCVRPEGHPGMHNDERHCWGSLTRKAGEGVEA